jgi:hypothetical protein
MQWNVGLEQSLGQRQTVTLSYVGAAGRDLTAQRLYRPLVAGNTNWNSGLYITENAASSNYNAMQAVFQRQLSHGLQALFSYTWSHAIDDASSNFTVYSLERSDSDFDIRRNIQAAITYDLPGKYGNAFVASVLQDWSLDTRISSVSAIPVNVGSGYVYLEDGTYVRMHPNRVEGEPLYVSTIAATGVRAPGGRAINYNAFTPAYDSSGVLTEGNVGRNYARAFGASELDMAVRKEFIIKEGLKLQFRAEAFNIFNHPQYGGVYNILTNGSSLFGRAYNTRNANLGSLNSLYQTGGPRSLQLALKLHF